MSVENELLQGQKDGRMIQYEERVEGRKAGWGSSFGTRRVLQIGCRAWGRREGWRDAQLCGVHTIAGGLITIIKQSELILQKSLQNFAPTNMKTSRDQICTSCPKHGKMDLEFSYMEQTEENVLRCRGAGLQMNTVRYFWMNLSS